MKEKTKSLTKTNLKTKSGTPAEVVVIVQPKGELMFSEEFLRMVQDYAYETLRSHLEKTKQTQAVNLLDDLILLSGRSSPGVAPTWMQSQVMCEAVASASKNVLALGGQFLSPLKK